MSALFLYLGGEMDNIRFYEINAKYVYNAKSHKTYKVTSKPCPKCKKVCSKPLKIRVSDTSKMRFFCPHCSSSFDISAIDILESIGLDNQKPKK